SGRRGPVTRFTLPSEVAPMLDRRAFLGSAAAASVAALRFPTLPVAVSRDPILPPAPALPSFALEQATLAGLQQGMQSRKWTARALTELYVARIEALDPQVRSVLEINPDAAAQADQLDAERRAKK